VARRLIRFGAAAGRLELKPVLSIALCFALILSAPALRAQAQPKNQPSTNGQTSQPANIQPPSRSQQQTNQNPFPDDTNSVPVMPSRGNPGSLPDSAGDAAVRMPLPAEDFDPVRTPEEAGVAAEGSESSSSSSLAGMSGLLPGPDDADIQPGRRNKQGRQSEPEHQETAAEDENVGKYYLDNQDWRAALSRFQSALVLDPDNPDVYWGLAESQRHLGDFADARTNYQKVVDYDPDSHHAKEARKALKDPVIANAKPSSPVQPSPSSQ